ncbi:MAG TPA: signal peptide peptidase SppA [Gammaproteobacteria bacterium]|nr:signal peptide peptidase SppA [Gammaproteobacteria bacterium]
MHIFGGMWKVWDFLCRSIVNLIITILVLLFLIGSLSEHRVIVPSSAALVVDIQGRVVEQLSGQPGQRAIDRMLGQKHEPETRLADIIEAIERAADDKRIKALVLATDQMQGAGLTKLQDIGRAIRDFKKSGKPVFALGSGYDQSQYYLAAQADTVFIHPQGYVFLQGYGVYQPYFKDALDKLGVEWNVFRVGKYKSAVEPFLRNDMSPEAREDYGQVLDDLWGDYQRDVTAARRLPGEAIKDYIGDLNTRLAAVGGDGAELALKSKLVDRIATPDEMQAAVAKVTGTSSHTFRQIDFRDYLAADLEPHGRGGEVAVVVAAGDIMDGDQPPGTVGGDSTSELIRRARYDDSVRALVLRVDSPGGSSFASDLILREVELTKEAGKPVVVSMGSLAASGGYWISMAGDQIFASPSTVTGSIGIFGMLPTFQNTLAKVGVHTDGLGTTPLSDAGDITRPMSPQMKDLFQQTIDHGYQEFITKVADHRHMKVQDVDAIAQGRVWSGTQAKKLGLVDKFGGIEDAEAAAAKLAGLGDNYSITYIEKPLSFSDRLLMSLAENSGEEGMLKAPSAGMGPWYGKLVDVAKGLDVFSDPHGVYAFCFCDIR